MRRGRGGFSIDKNQMDARLPRMVEGVMDFSLDERSYQHCPWVYYALAEYGVREVPGEGHNPRVLEYLSVCTEMKRLKGKASLKTDETPWCSAFVNWCLMKAGKSGTLRTNAKSFQNTRQWDGHELHGPKFGCVVVVQRGEPDRDQGHAGFYIRDDSSTTWILGGNQGPEGKGRVSVWGYRKDRYPPLGYFWPR